MPRFPLALLVVVSSGCSVVKAARVAEDWPREDGTRVKRLAVVVQPLPDGQPAAAAAFARIARRYVNQKRDFLVKVELPQAEAPALEAVCGGEERIEGVLFLRVALARKGGGFEAALDGSLKRCGDGREAWSVQAAGSFGAADEGLREVTAVYMRELGNEVEPYVAPAMNLLRPALDTLPNPALTEEDRDEKLSLD